jgi:hypothetical protein
MLEEPCDIGNSKGCSSQKVELCMSKRNKTVFLKMAEQIRPIYS